MRSRKSLNQTPSLQSEIILATEQRRRKDDTAVYRPASASWLINYATGSTAKIQWGWPNIDVPIIGSRAQGNFDSVAVFRYSDGQTYCHPTGAR